LVEKPRITTSLRQRTRGLSASNEGQNKKLLAPPRNVERRSRKGKNSNNGSKVHKKKNTSGKKRKAG